MTSPLNDEYYLKANALIASFLEGLETKVDPSAEMSYIIKDLDLGEDGKDLSLALIASGATVVATIAKIMGESAHDLWLEFVESSNS